MRRIAHLLVGAAGVIWLSTCGFVEPSGQAFAQEAVPKLIQEAVRMFAPAAGRMMMAQEDALVQQFEQQFGVQFRQLYRTELHFMRFVCQPTKQQYEKIAAEGETALKATVKKFAVNWRDLQQGRPSAFEQSDPRAAIADALAKLVRATLSPEQAARYQKELDLRAEARKRVVLLNLVAKVDKVLVLTTEQRDKLREILEDNWKDSWNQTQMLMYGGQHFPSMPDLEIRLILTATQKNVWSDIPKGDIRFGFHLGFVQGIEIEEEVWDDEQPQKNPERLDGKAAVTGKGTTKPVEKK
jgi:hypothetical protein